MFVFSVLDLEINSKTVVRLFPYSILVMRFFPYSICVSDAFLPGVPFNKHLSQEDRKHQESEQYGRFEWLCSKQRFGLKELALSCCFLFFLSNK